ncbi:MAG: hypothetical protein Q8K82_01140 [Gemmatimonadaceae bacterium]|nr:hypothetical protein [Gemmatimonadaceae bacterium]
MLLFRAALLRRVGVRGTVPPLGAAAVLRDSLLAAGGTMRVDWSPSTDPAATQASGDVVWSGTQQRGVLRLVGLAPNDPRSAQYQLWIVDAERDARYPVDGGVFDLLPNGEVLVLAAPVGG